MYYVESSRPDTEAIQLVLRNPSTTEFLLEDLKKWTAYRVWLLAGTVVGVGPASDPLTVRTQEDGKNPCRLTPILPCHKTIRILQGSSFLTLLFSDGRNSSLFFILSISFSMGFFHSLSLSLVPQDRLLHLIMINST